MKYRKVKHKTLGDVYWVSERDFDNIGTAAKVQCYLEVPGCRQVSNGFICSRRSIAEAASKKYVGEFLEFVGDSK